MTKRNKKKVKVKAAISSARKWVTAFISKRLVGGVIPETGGRGRGLQSYLKATQKRHRLCDACRLARQHLTFLCIYLFIHSFIYLFIYSVFWQATPALKISRGPLFCRQRSH